MSRYFLDRACFAFFLCSVIWGNIHPCLCHGPWPSHVRAHTATTQRDSTRVFRFGKSSRPAIKHDIWKIGQLWMDVLLCDKYFYYLFCFIAMNGQKEFVLSTHRSGITSKCSTNVLNSKNTCRPTPPRSLREPGPRQNRVSNWSRGALSWSDLSGPRWPMSMSSSV